MSEQNKAPAREFYEEVLNKGNVDAADRLCDPKFVDHNPLPGFDNGIAAMNGMVAMMKAGFPDLHMTVDEMIAEDDVVAVRISGTGTHQGTFMGASPTGKKLQFHGLDMLYYKNGKETETWHYGDDMMMELGIINLPG